ncbi:uncharacterized protein LOC143269061 isoform X2 [Peromyscus maniculatus bairdii]|uniref:uncharacterized protein LOC143269061 isoform X2 n=1 Tax=Peromyscus maniculatus bairdii TaxID=230844 RepID=UPI003FD2359A
MSGLSAEGRKARVKATCARVRPASPRTQHRGSARRAAPRQGSGTTGGRHGASPGDSSQVPGNGNRRRTGARGALRADFATGFGVVAPEPPHPRAPGPKFPGLCNPGAPSASGPRHPPDLSGGREEEEEVEEEEKEEEEEEGGPQLLASSPANSRSQPGCGLLYPPHVTRPAALPSPAGPPSGPSRRPAGSSSSPAALPPRPSALLPRRPLPRRLFQLPPRAAVPSRRSPPPAAVPPPGLPSPQSELTVSKMAAVSVWGISAVRAGPPGSRLSSPQA